MKNMDTAIPNLNIYPSAPLFKKAPSRWSGSHNYNDHRFYYVINGSFVLNIDDSSYIVRKHQLALLPANHPHTYWLTPARHLEYFDFSFKAYIDNTNAFEFLGMTDNNHVISLPCDKVTAIYNNMINNSELHDNIPDRFSLVSETARLMALYIQARISMENVKLEYSEVIAYMKEHIFDDITLDDLAAKAHLNPSYFSAKFKETVGISPMRYFAQLRAKHAAKLLKTTDMSLEDVAQSIGISDIYYFKRYFARYMGIHPEKYRSSLVPPSDLRFSLL